jgi:flagellar biogenesis protein FliO
MSATARGVARSGDAVAGPATIVALAVFANPSAAFAQSLTGNSALPELSPWRIVLATLLIAAMAVAVVLLRRGSMWRTPMLRRPRDADTALHVLARVCLDAHNSVTLLEAGGRRWLLGVGPQGPTLLAELVPPSAGPVV